MKDSTRKVYDRCGEILHRYWDKHYESIQNGQAAFYNRAGQFIEQVNALIPMAETIAAHNAIIRLKNCITDDVNRVTRQMVSRGVWR